MDVSKVAGGYSVITNELIDFISEVRPNSVEIAVYLHILKRCSVRGKHIPRSISISGIARELTISKPQKVRDAIKKWKTWGYLATEADTRTQNGYVFHLTSPSVSDQTLVGGAELGGGAMAARANRTWRHEPNGHGGTGQEDMAALVKVLKGFTGRPLGVRNYSSINNKLISSISARFSHVGNFLTHNIKSKKKMFENEQEFLALINQFGEDLVIYGIESLSNNFLFDKIKVPYRFSTLLRNNLNENHKAWRGEIDQIEISLHSEALALHAKLKEKQLKGQRNFVPTNQEKALFDDIGTFFISNEPEDILKQANRWKAEKYAELIISHKILSIHQEFGFNNGGLSHV